MELSTFRNLFLLFIAKSPHSLAHHPLHKRSESCVSELTEGAASGSSSHTSQRTLVTPNPQEATLASHGCQPIELEDITSQERYQHQHIHAPSNSAPSTSIDPDEPSLWYPSDHPHQQRFFSHASDLQQAFGKLPKAKDEIHNLVMKAAIGGSDQMISSIDDTLHAVTVFLSKLLEPNNLIPSYSEVIRLHLEDIDTLNIGDVVERVGTAGSIYGSEQLIQRKSIIADHLAPFLKHLSGLHGLLGPRNLFKSEISNLLSKWIVSPHLPPNFDLDVFFSDLDALERAFTSIVKYYDGNDVEEVNRTPLAISFAVDTVNKEPNVNRVEVKSEFLREPQAVLPLIEKIESSEVYKNLRLELETPVNLPGYELGLVEPLGVTDTPRPNLTDQFLTANFGMPSTDGYAGEFRHISKHAFLNTRQRLSIARDALKLKERIWEHDHHVMDALVAYFKGEIPKVEEPDHERDGKRMKLYR